VELPFVDTRTLAAVYRRASVLMLPSDREGFGLPLLEALASGTPAVVSDTPALRETGGNAAFYCAPGDAAAFDAAVSSVLAAPDSERRRRGLEHAASFTWTAHAARAIDVYREVASLE
jgi:glycosyltransferase involved in cell wall biosynthesis